MTQHIPQNGRRRFDREFDRIARIAPFIQRLRRPGWMIGRIVVGVFFILGGFLAILPVFGLWMIPLGLLLLAIDIPALQGPLATVLVKGRHWWRRLKK